MAYQFSLKDSVYHVAGILDTFWTSVEPITSTETDTEIQSFLTATVAPIAKRFLPNGDSPRQSRKGLQGDRIRVFDQGASIAFRLDGIDPATRVRVDLYSLRGERLAVLHDAPSSSSEELVLDLVASRRGPRDELCIVVFQAGDVRSSRILALSGR